MEEVPNTFPWMFLGYAAIFSVIIIYVLSLGRRMQRMERQLLGDGAKRK